MSTTSRDIPRSRWRPDGVHGPARGRPGRVAAAQAQARSSLGTSLGLVVAAVVAAVWPGVEGWVALHLFLAGAVVVAISGSMLLFAVTWSAGSAPPSWAAQVQRWGVVLGVAGIVIGRSAGWPPLLAAGGVLYLGALVALAALVLQAVATGPERRFDAAAAWYVAAIAAGIVGGGMGVAMGVGGSDRWAGDVRGAHLVLNVFGLVGFTVLGTLPSFVATQLRMRMSARADRCHLVGLLIWQVGALAAATGGLLLGWTPAAGAGLAGLALGMVMVVTMLPSPGRRQLRWAGPRIVNLVAGWAWLVGGVAATAFAASRGDDVLPVRLVVIVAVCGLGQLVWGSLAYLLPVLRGGAPEELGAAFRMMRSWPAVVSANLVGVAAVAGLVPVAVLFAAIWLADVAVRVARLTLGSADRSGSQDATGVHRG